MKNKEEMKAIGNYLLKILKSNYPNLSKKEIRIVFSKLYNQHRQKKGK